MNTDKMLATNTVEEFRTQVKSNFDKIPDFYAGNNPSVFCNGTNAYISVANNANINFGTGTFSIITEQLFESGSSIRHKIIKITANIGIQLQHNANNTITMYVGDGTNTLICTSSYAITDGNFHKIGFILGRDIASSKLVIDGIEDIIAVKTGNYPTLTKTNSFALQIGSAASVFHKNEVRNTQLYNYALTVENCRRYMYESLPYSEIGANNTDLTAGNGSFATDTTGWWNTESTTKQWVSTADTQGDLNYIKVSNPTSSYLDIVKSLLTVGKIYRITYRAKSQTRTTQMEIYNVTSAFTIGTNPNLTTTFQNYQFEFVAVNTSMYIRLIGGAQGLDLEIDDIIIQQIGCVLDLSSDGITPTKWNDKLGRMYADFTNAIANNLPMNATVNLPYSAITGNSTVIVPAGYSIDRIYIKNTTANAVTGGIKIGTTSGGTDVVNALAIGANYNNIVEDSSIVAKQFFSDTANTTLYLQAVTSWNSASLNITLICRRVV